MYNPVYFPFPSNSICCRPGEGGAGGFQEPGAPPNSVERVERTLQEYDDDLFSTTDDIELS